jgi:hypothetical protein
MQQSDLANLPPDVQAQIAQLLRQRGAAGQMVSNSMAPVQNEVISGRVIPMGGGQILAKALSAYFGNRGLEKADEGIAGIRQKDLERYSGEASALTGDQSREAIVRALASKDPRIAALAASLQKRNDERLDKWAGHAGKVDAPMAANSFRDGVMPDVGGFKEPQITPVEFAGRTVPAVTNFREGGRPDMTVPALNSTNITTQLPTKEADMSLDTLKADLKERKDRAQIAKETLSSNRVAIEAINEGAKSGGLQTWAQTARKIAQGLGIEFDENTPTTVLNMAMGNAVLAKARALAPVTGEDVKRLQEILGSIETDPSALARWLSVYEGMALKELQDYNQYVDYQTKNLKSDYAKDMFSGAKLGYEIPAPAGTPSQGARAIQELAKRGGDQTNFTIAGEQVPPDAQFDIRGTTSTGKPAQPSAPLRIDQLTPEQKKALAAELKRLGM